MHFKPIALDIGQHHADVVEFDPGKNVLRNRADFRSLTQERLVVALGDARCGMVQIEAVGLEATLNLLEKGVMIGQANVLDHLYLANLVEFPLDSSVVLQLNPYTIAETASRDLIARVGIL